MTNEYNNILDYVSGSWLETIWILIIIILGVIAYRWIKNKGIQNTNQKEEKTNATNNKTSSTGL